MIIEDVDYTIERGDAIQELFSEIVLALTNRYKVVLTGVDISHACKAFLSAFPDRYRLYVFSDQKKPENQKDNEER